MKKIFVLLILFLLLGSMIPVNADPAPPEKLEILYLPSGQSNIVLMESAMNNVTVATHVNLTCKIASMTTDVSDWDLTAYDVVLFNHVEQTVVSRLEPKLDAAKAQNLNFKVAAVSTPSVTSTLSLVDGSTNYTECFVYLGVDNMEIALLYLAKKTGHYEGPVPVPVAKSIYGIYHPDKWSSSNPYLFDNVSEYLTWYADSTRDGNLHVYDPDKPTIGVIPSTSLKDVSRDGPIIDYLVREIENQGYNVIVGTYVMAAATGSKPNENKENFMIITETGSDTNYEVVIDAAIALSRGGRLFSSNGDLGQQELEALGVPILNGVQLYSGKTQSDWENSDQGVFSDQLYQLAFAEMDGMIEPIVIAGKDEFGYNMPIDYQADWMVKRAISWAELGNKSNNEKKIVIPYYAAEAGKANIGADPDYYLDGPGSILEILKALKTAGYNLGNDELPSKGELIEQMTKYGYNVGTWAPGQLQKMAEDGYAIMLPLNDYLAFYNTLDSSQKAAVESVWGAPPGDIMVYENSSGKYFVIPALKFGNVVLTPTPLRGRDQSQDALSRNGNYPPTHQALAMYYYFGNASQYNADAMVPIWTNLAVMPGKQAGLSAKDWTAIMIGDMPIIHPLPVDSTGLTDKRRANMAIVNFLTPVLTPSGLYGNLSTLEFKIGEYKTTADDSVKAETLDSIIDYCNELGFSTSLGINWESDKSDAVKINQDLEIIEKHLRGIKGSYIPYGDHIFGKPPSDTLISGKTYSELDLMAEAIHIQNSGISTEEAKNLLNKSTDEMTNLLRALSGKSIPIGSTGDPVYKPEVLPTGKNPVQNDSRYIPTDDAWKIGKNLTGKLIEIYQEKNGAGKYPEKVAFLLWAIETTRNKGTSESEIFYLMGVEPVWATSGSGTNRVTGVQLIAGWNKPRVDIVVETSGSYRDVYSQQVLLINDAAKLAANAPDKGQPNYVKINSNEIESALIAKGYNSTFAKEISTARVFGPPPGEYTPGIENLAGSDLENTTTAADLYIERMSYAYGVNLTYDKDGNDLRVDGKVVTQWGIPVPEVLTQNLKKVEMGVFSRSSNVYGLLDHPMVASYFGGLAAAITKSGGNADMYINNQRNGGEGVESLGEFLNAELNSRAFNPKWIEGMMNSGYAGTTHMEEMFGALGVWDMTMPGLVTGDTWSKLNDIYVNDSTNQGVSDFLKSSNPYAYQSMVGSLLNAAYNGQWEPTADQLKQLQQEYVQQTVLNGVVCCHHTCSNMNFNNRIMNGLMALDLPEEMKREYVDTVNIALDKSYNPSLNPSSAQSSGSGTGTAKIVNSSENNTSDNTSNATSLTESENSGSGYGKDSTPAGVSQVTGYEMISQSIGSTASAVRDFISNPSVSSSSAIAIALVILLIGAVFYGYRKKGV
ncbi:cobaltochelatase subunit CobN [Methanolapillus ohkumae]|uniref:CobN/magnesium chelatase domain-containing protein n=1 Tax=Methanolapillus ohkumae TaxID=3028298 RepID=A0AA96V620_9EURY|nr:hypothetical protein MsAm2_03630 [Methanosarcinaceae archaeon Am2]